TEPAVGGGRVVGDGGRAPRPPGGRAMLVLLPDDAGGQLGRVIVREPAVSCGCDHVRRPRGVDQPRHGGDATAVGGGAVTWAAPRPSTLHGRTTLRLLRLGDPPHL